MGFRPEATTQIDPLEFFLQRKAQRNPYNVRIKSRFLVIVLLKGDNCMTQADLTALSQLSEEQRAALSDDLRAIYCILSPADRAFFAETFSARDLPKALTHKGEILSNNQANRDKLQRLKNRLHESDQALASPAPGQPGLPNQKTDDIFNAVAAAVGLGAAGAMIATDNSAHWQGLFPRDLIPALNTEFQNKAQTDIEFEGSETALEGTVYVAASNRFVPALTIHLTRVQNGLDVKMGDLTSSGVLETIRGGGDKLLRLAQKGLILWGNRGRGNPADLIGMANSALSDGTDLAEVAGNLRLKERAWGVIKSSAEALEKAYQDKLTQEREARYALESAWDHYYTCPTCAVPFQAGDTTCRVCATARPTQPVKPDPRKM